jgi:hypothetical protein
MAGLEFMDWDCASPFLEPILLRWEILDAFPESFNAAAIAAWAVDEAAALTLFRRLTLWVGFVAESDME